MFVLYPLLSFGLLVCFLFIYLWPYLLFLYLFVSSFHVFIHVRSFLLIHVMVFNDSCICMLVFPCFFCSLHFLSIHYAFTSFAPLFRELFVHKCQLTTILLFGLFLIWIDFVFLYLLIVCVFYLPISCVITYCFGFLISYILLYN